MMPGKQNTRQFIITTTDTGCPHSCTLTRYDAEIVVPDEDKTYQYLIQGKNELVKKILITRVLEELYNANVKNSILKIEENIILTNEMKKYLRALSQENTVDQL